VSGQELDVKRSWRAIRRHRKAVAACAIAGLLGGITLGAFFPPLHTATSLVVLPPPPVAAPDTTATAAHSVETQVLIATSEPVLASAGQNLDPPLDRETVNKRVEVTAVTRDVIEVQGQGTSEDEAIALTNAVTRIYLVFITTEQDLPGDLGDRSGARVLQAATTARGGSPFVHYGLFGLLGGLGGSLLGAVGVLAVARGDRRLRLRDEVANAVGIPVLGSVSSYPARDVTDWAELLEDYQPTALDAWSLQRVLHSLGVDTTARDSTDSDDAPDRRETGTVSVAVITFGRDDKALALGPQLAAFARSIGVATSLVVDARVAAVNALLGDPEADLAFDNAAAQAGNGYGPSKDRTAPALQINLIVVDPAEPHLADTHHTTAAIVGLSSGAVTGEELARLVVAAAATRREINGIVVADPEPTDRTTGRLPQLMRQGSSRLPAILTGTARKASR
jgi:capsular polysaccharide biosynthesis protein